jgi:hypothetical protein
MALKKRKKSFRARVIDGLEKRRGPGCQCCGMNFWYKRAQNQNDPPGFIPDDKRHMFFCIDHVHETGSISRKTLGRKGNAFFKWVIDHDYPDNVQLLCHSCNQAKRLNGGICPHEPA